MALNREFESSAECPACTNHTETVLSTESWFMNRMLVILTWRIAGSFLVT